MNILWLEALEPNQIALNTNLLKKMSNPNKIIVNFGSLKIKMNVVIKNDFSEGNIGLPIKLSEVYTIPTDIPYECFVKGEELYIGPVIAFVVFGSFTGLKNRVFFLTLPRFLDYRAIKGLIVICTRDSIDVEAGSIEGYYFDPKGQQPEEVWKYGKFPLPNAIYNRSFMAQNKISALRKKIGDKVFNSYWYNLNKWRMWKLLATNERLKKHLPYTQKFFSIKQLARILRRKNSVYLKPCNRSRGKGIILVTKTNKGILVVDDKREKFFLPDYQSMAKYFKRKITIPYIIQQAVPFKISNQHLDFRVILQKDDSKLWSCSGVMARISLKGGIITNGRGRDKSLLGREALATFYNLSEDSAKKIETEMIHLVIEAVQMYEQKGMHLGDLAADLILDANVHLWLLEIQLNHGVDGRSSTLPDELFGKFLTTPFKYGKALAGFNADY